MPRLREEQRIKLPIELRNRILRDTGYRCAHCNQLLKSTREDDFSIEHVVPLRKGGSNNPRNLIALCKACNEEKQDDIIDPREYYTYAPEWKLKEVCETFDTYIQEIDWLAYDTLFKLDRFDLHTKKSMYKPRSQKIFFVDATYQVRRMRRQEVHDYLLEYTGHLATTDKSMMAYEHDDINTTYYRIMGKDQTIMIISPYILNTDYGEPEGKKRTTVFLDAFVNFNIKIRPPASYSTIANILRACCNIIRDTIEMRNPRNGEVVDCIIRTPYSDKTCVESIKMFKRMYYNYIGASDPFINGDETDPRNVNLLMRFYNGTREDLYAEADAAGVSRKEYHTDILTRQDGIKQRLETSREVKSDNKIKRITKKQKKAKNKKPRHKT